MRYWIGLTTILIVLISFALWIAERIPAAYNPMAPISVSDSPNLITRYKLRRLDNNPQGCLEALERAQAAGAIQFTSVGNMGGRCPLKDPVRVRGFGDVSLSSSYLASCRLALSSAMFVSQVAKPLATEVLRSPLVRIDHLGSYACRNIYNKPNARLSEHATAEALDIAGFRLKDGRQLTVLKQWSQTSGEGQFIHTLFTQSCLYFGNSIGPDYNAAHANHFHLGLRWFGFCR
ncbi:extensin [Enterobacteriaceae bacterium Kacie_13]|nr:extensin [Enterobacteriaceae bacterium Kacie_13]